MKKTILALALSSVIAAPIVHAAEITTDEDKLSYGLGMVLGQRLKADFDTLNYDLLKQGIQDLFEGNTPAMTEGEIAKTMMDFQAKKMEQQRAQEQAIADENQAAGEKFLADNAKKDGVVVTESGLQFESVEAGTGPSPTSEDNVKVHYRGTLTDGREFDSSYGRGEPVTFPLAGVIKGWTEGLQLMKEGGKARLVIPADLAYGPGGAGGLIGPNMTLVFEVELLKVNPED